MTTAATLAAVAGACDAGGDATNLHPVEQPAFDPTPHGLAEDSPEVLGMLRLLNHPETTFEVLDEAAGLTTVAARQLIDYRDGRGESFDSLAEIYAVDGVDKPALAQLAHYVTDKDWLPGGDPWLGHYDGVHFRLSEADRTLTIANGAPREALDSEVGLYSSAVNSIVVSRPINTLRELAALKHVGPASLKKLRDYALQLADLDAPPCPAEPILTAAEAGAVDFQSGDFTVCVPATDGACPAAGELDAPVIIKESVGEPYWGQYCSWEAAAHCGPFQIGPQTCCYVASVESVCK